MMQRNYLLVPVRVLALILWVVSMPLIFLLASLLRIPRHTELPQVFHAGMRAIFGIRVQLINSATELRPALYVSNHISYLDIIVLGGLKAFFIAKSEVASWPVFGQLARFQNTLFIERKSGKTRHQLGVMQAHLRKGERLILFAEGTSTDGVHVEPFKSSLFEAANLGDTLEVAAGGKAPRVAIQAITIAYTHHAGRAMNQTQRDYYAWYARMPFGAHFAKLFSLKKVDVKVVFHPVCYLDEFSSRKECAEHCHRLVAQTLDKLIAQAG